ncbi:hypothetical protein IU500_24545 [Nocardia terpenica]|uniref:hypothetical protein n=1 Tax=Nocardia terpenica TaxID=455432 RepID=UPI001896163A|nr:hypothetical protein [Nocardia terpenica]MBF6064670.1 hypothetical protein [Nocardia terpenica]MBF6107186.1 hypothetical protein [Nocardia terpenica]MBF6114944.1 hypothetical protein [Nocardia terpenica]MBF6122049.1 hypothetical protein [Nocardia terpenica]MBF6154432.1 hypothetical protein [Nocardia terpenica]
MQILGWLLATTVIGPGCTIFLGIATALTLDAHTQFTLVQRSGIRRRPAESPSTTRRTACSNSVSANGHREPAPTHHPGQAIPGLAPSKTHSAPATGSTVPPPNGAPSLLAAHDTTTPESGWSRIVADLVTAALYVGLAAALVSLILT